MYLSLQQFVSGARTSNIGEQIEWPELSSELGRRTNCPRRGVPSGAAVLDNLSRFPHMPVSSINCEHSFEGHCLYYQYKNAGWRARKRDRVCLVDCLARCEPDHGALEFT